MHIPITFTFIATVVGLIVVGVVLRRRRFSRPQGSHTFRDYVRAGLYAWFPFGPGPGSIGAQLLRWARCEQLPVTAERSLAPCGIVFGLTTDEFDTVSARVAGLEFAIVEAIVEEAQAHGRRLLTPEPWAVIRSDPRARPGLPTVDGCYDVSMEAPQPVRAEGRRGGWAADRRTKVESAAAGGRGSRGQESGPGTRRAAAATQREGAATVSVDHWLEVDGFARRLIGRVVVGRGHGADVELLHPQVSRRHATLKVVGTAVYVEDLGSFNGTLVDQVRITGPVELVPGSVLRFGPQGPTVTYRSDG